MKSPGHEKWPDHKVQEAPVNQTVRVELNGETIAESNRVIKVEEDGYPTRYYFSRSDVEMDKLERTDTTTKCPFKGTAHYFSVNVGGKNFKDAVWTYEEPYEEHQALANRVAFYDDRVPEIQIRVS